MTNVSKKKLNEKVAKEIWSQLGETIGRLSANQASSFLSSILTTSEQIMLAKRLASIVLIHEKHSDYAISKTLLMSNTTVSKLRLNYSNSDYQSVISGIKKNKADYLAFIDNLVEIIHFGLPRYAGPRRFKLKK